MRRTLYRMRGSVQRERPESITPRDEAETIFATVEGIPLRHRKSPAIGGFSFVPWQLRLCRRLWLEAAASYTVD